MSIWTHVNGSIRFDYLRITKELDLKGIIGNTCGYDDRGDDDWKNCTVPCGSEGSLQYSIWTNPHKNSLAAYTVNIWGDLRDYEDHSEIKLWFQRILNKAPVRNVVLEVEVESRSAFIYYYDSESESLIEIKKDGH